MYGSAGQTSCWAGTEAGTSQREREGAKEGGQRGEEGRYRGRPQGWPRNPAAAGNDWAPRATPWKLRPVKRSAAVFSIPGWCGAVGDEEI